MASNGQHRDLPLKFPTTNSPFLSMAIEENTKVISVDANEDNIKVEVCHPEKGAYSILIKKEAQFNVAQRNVLLELQIKMLKRKIEELNSK